jgi:hypothetical protein
MSSNIQDSGDLYLSYLDVLDEEDRALTGSVDAPVDPLRAAYWAARSAGDSDQREETERPFRQSLFRRLHERRRTALCFSGGGIRSATFGLGIVQGLAAFSRAEGSGRPQLLGEFDYLSTVSGGGYLGSWLSAWSTRIARGAGVRLRDDSCPDHCDGPAAVVQELSNSPDSTFEPEPAPVRYLRDYTNYLVPRAGLLSADTWALAATVIRNMFLNWLVLIPLFAAVLLIPVLARRLLAVSQCDVGPETLWVVLLSAITFGGLATAYVGYDLPNAGNCRRPAKWFILLGLLPLSLAAVHLNIFWAWLPTGNPSAAWWNVVALGKSGLAWWHFVLFGVLMHGGGMLAGIVYVSIRYDRPPRLIGLATTAAAAVTGFVGGLVGFWASHRPLTDAAGQLINTKLYAVFAFPATMLIFSLSGALLVGATSYVTEDEDREWWARAGGWYSAAAAGWAVFALVVLYATETLNWLDGRVTASFAAATGLTGWTAARLGASSETSSGRRTIPSDLPKSAVNHILKEYGAQLILPVFLVLLTMTLAASNTALLRVLSKAPVLVPSFWPELLRPLGDATAHELWLMVAYVVLSLTASWFINVNKFSLHGMYRQRLIRAYLGASNTARRPNPFTGFDENDNLSMCALTDHKPLHVVNMTLNLVHGSNLAWQQRKAEPFTGTRLHTGSCRVGYRPSTLYGGRYKEHPKKTPISLGTAISISGAAASPNMGFHSSPLLTLVMTLFNARLGWWLGNPKAGGGIWKRPGPRFGILPFIEEAFGLTDDTNDWIYLSDGGHFENLGLYEMVLRRCHLIVVSDAGADPNYTYEDLANAVRKIRIDLGIPIEFESPSMPMSPKGEPTKRFGAHHCAIGRIRYEAVDSGAETGTIIYIKASLNGNEPADVKQYAAVDKSFPHQSTSDQFFDESQFESYRRLGLHIIEEICDAVTGTRQQMDLHEFKCKAEEYVRRPIGLPDSESKESKKPNLRGGIRTY